MGAFRPPDSKNQVHFDLGSFLQGQNQVDIVLFLFDMLYVISQPFLKISTSNFVHIFMRHCPLTNVPVFFSKILIWGETVLKIKNWTFFENFQNFENFENPRKQFCSPTNSTSFHISQLIVALKLHQWRRFP